MKYMNMKKKYQTLDLQLFAGEDEDGSDGDDSGDGDDQDDDESDEDGEEERRFTQEEVDEAVKKRLAREKRKWQREHQKKSDGQEESGEDGEDDREKREAIDKASRLEVRCACYEAGVSKDAVDDVTALARAYMAADEDLDLEDAIEKVVKKYPQFKKGSADPYEDEDETKGKSWGQRQNGRIPKKMTGVEKRFYELNPDLK